MLLAETRGWSYPRRSWNPGRSVQEELEPQRYCLRWRDSGTNTLVSPSPASHPSPAPGKHSLQRWAPLLCRAERGRDGIDLGANGDWHVRACTHTRIPLLFRATLLLDSLDCVDQNTHSEGMIFWHYLKTLSMEVNWRKLKIHMQFGPKFSKFWWTSSAIFVGDALPDYSLIMSDYCLNSLLFVVLLKIGSDNTLYCTRSLTWYKWNNASAPPLHLLCIS